MTASKPAKQRWQPSDHFESSQALFRDAAYAMIKSGSLRELSMRGLASAVGASSMTAYRYYADKEALIEDVRRMAWQNFARHLQSATTEPTSAEERFRRQCDAYLRFALDCEPEFRLIFEPPNKARRQEPENLEAWQILLGLVADLAPDLDEEQVVRFAFHTWSTMHGLAMLHLSYGLAFDRSVNDVMRTNADALIFVIQHAGKTS